MWYVLVPIFVVLYNIVGFVFTVHYLNQSHDDYYMREIPNVYTLILFVLFWPLVEFFSVINRLIS